MTAERGLTFLDAALADPLRPPASQLLVFGIFNFFFFKKCQSCVQHTWVSKHNRGGWSVLFWRGRGERGENNHTTQPRTTSRSIRGNSDGGGLAACSETGEGESGTPSHAPHAAWHARPAPTAVIRLPTTSHCARSFPQTQAGGSPSRHLHGMEDTAQQQGTSFEFFRHREVKREQREALVEHRPQPTVCATGPGVWPLLGRGQGQTVARPGTAFVSS